MSMLELGDCDDDSFVVFDTLLNMDRLMVTSDDGTGKGVCVVLSKDDAFNLVEFIQDWLGV